jgi:hypothetical protein
MSLFAKTRKKPPTSRPKKKPAGRRSFKVNTDQRRQARQRAALIAALEGGNSRSAACGQAGISRETFYRWLTESDSFKKEVECAESEPITALEDAAFRIARNPKHPKQTTMLIFLLKCRAGYREVDSTARVQETPAALPPLDIKKPAEPEREPLPAIRRLPQAS